MINSAQILRAYNVNNQEVSIAIETEIAKQLDNQFDLAMQTLPASIVFIFSKRAKA